MHDRVLLMKCSLLLKPNKDCSTCEKFVVPCSTKVPKPPEIQIQNIMFHRSSGASLVIQSSIFQVPDPQWL